MLSLRASGCPSNERPVRRLGGSLPGERGCGDGTTLALLACVVLGWPGKSTPVPPGGRCAAGKRSRRVRQTGPHNLLGRWATWPPPAEGCAKNSEGAARQIQDRAV